MSKKYTLLTFKGICMNFLLKLKFFILGHPVTSKQPQEIIQIILGHPVHLHTYLKLDVIFVHSLTLMLKSFLDSGGVADWMGDTFCDDINNNEKCNYDDGDCCGFSMNYNFCIDCTCKCKLNLIRLLNCT